MNLICKMCGNPFNSRAWNAMYCCDACREAGRNGRVIENKASWTPSMQKRAAAVQSFGSESPEYWQAFKECEQEKLDNGKNAYNRVNGIDLSDPNFAELVSKSVKETGRIEWRDARGIIEEGIQLFKGDEE